MRTGKTEKQITEIKNLRMLYLFEHLLNDVERINKDDIEIIEYFKKLTPKQQQYYSHLIKADVLKEEMENETKDIIK